MKNIIKFLWIIAYGTIIFLIFNEYNKFTSCKDWSCFLESSILGIHKLLFDINIFFTIFLCINIQRFSSPMIFLRCRNGYVKYLVLRGTKLSFFYVLVTYVFYILIPLIHGYQLNITLINIGSMLYLLIFVMTMYLCYIAIVLLINNHLIGIITTFLINILMLIFLNNFLGYTPQYQSIIFRLVNVLICFISISIIMYQDKHKEFLSWNIELYYYRLHFLFI